MQALFSTLKALKIGSPIASGPLTVFPLLHADAPPLPVRLLQGAASGSGAAVSHRSAAAR